MEELVLSINLVRFPEARGGNLYALLSDQVENIEIYEPNLPGPIMASGGIPWKVVGKFNTVASIFAALFGIYAILKEEYKPKDPQAGISVHVHNVHVEYSGSNNVFYIGRDYGIDEDSLVRLRDSLIRLKEQIDSMQTKIQVQKLRESNEWKKIK